MKFVYFAIENKIDPDDRKKSWPITRETLKFSREEFQEIESFATARRHGQRVNATEQQIDEAVILVWNILRRFISLVDQ